MDFIDLDIWIFLLVQLDGTLPRVTTARGVIPRNREFLFIGLGRVAAAKLGKESQHIH